MTTAALQQEATYLQRVYAWLTLGVTLCSGVSYVSVTLGAPVSVPTEGGSIATVPPTVALVLQHPIATSLIFLAFALAAGVFRKSQVAGIPFFVGFTSFTGIFIGPSIYMAQMAAAKGETLTAHPVRDASLLTIFTFVGLTIYTAWSKRDFSAWGASLTTGLWVIIGASILNIFLGSSVTDLAISSAAVVLFAGFMIYDTFNILRRPDGDHIGAALNMFLNLVNFFLHILRLFVGRGSRSD